MKVNPTLVLLIYGFLCLSAPVHGNVDSLKTSLIQHSKSKNDSLFDQTLRDLVFEYRNFDVPKAIKYANNGIELATKLNREDRLDYWYGILGELYVLHDEQILALETYAKGLHLAEKRGLNTAWWYIDIGNVYYSDNLNLYKAKKYYEKAIEEFNKLDNANSHAGLAVAYNNVGLVYESMEKYQKAIQFYKMGLKIRQEIQDTNLLRHSYNMLANAFINTNIDSSGSYFKKLYHIVKGTPQEFNYYLNISELYRVQRNFVEAENSIAAAEKIALRLKLNTFLPLVYREYAQIDLDEYKLKDALNHAQAGLDYADQEGLINFALPLIELIIEISEEQSDYKQLAQYQKLYIELKDSLHENQVRNAEINFELEEHNDEVVFLKSNIQKLTKHEHELEEENEIQHEYLITFEWGLAIAIISLFFLWLSFRKQRKQREEIELNHREILESINYANTIQSSILPRQDIYDHTFENYFLLYKSKEKLSGDFHYLKITQKNIVFALGDCTGHGVPGAMLSILGINYLNESIRRSEVETPADVLEQLKYLFASVFQHSKKADGMDLGMIAISKSENYLQYSGATIPLYIIRNGKIIKHKATRSPIGKHLIDIPFENNRIELQNGDKIYLFSDGFVDQFGGETNPTRKYSRKRFLNRLLETSHLPMSEQKKVLWDNLQKWKGSEEQTDDITVFGFEYKTN